jgi:prepilin-type N-terminal cleavage/methylation domain-containing protein
MSNHPVIQKKKGFTLIEFVIYISIIVIVLVIVVGIIVNMSQSYQHIVVAQQISDSSATAFERITREVRNADSVDVSGSTLDSNPGALVVNTTANGTSETREFLVSSGMIRVLEDDVDMGPLTMSDVTVSNLVFRVSTSTYSTAVKIEMTLDAGSGEYARSENFYSTVILRGSYE